MSALQDERRDSQAVYVGTAFKFYRPGVDSSPAVKTSRSSSANFPVHSAKSDRRDAAPRWRFGREAPASGSAPDGTSGEDRRDEHQRRTRGLCRLGLLKR